jgi:hypothetical protein
VGYKQWSVGGFRYEGGAWQVTELEPASPGAADVENFGNIAQNPSGAVLAAVPYEATGGPPLTIAVFRYTPGVGWDTETAATEGDTGESRCRIAWFQSSEAVAIYNDSGVEEAAFYSNGTWSSGPPIPGGYGTNSPGIATAPDGDVLFVMAASNSDESLGVLATWLVP